VSRLAEISKSKYRAINKQPLPSSEENPNILGISRPVKKIDKISETFLAVSSLQISIDRAFQQFFLPGLDRVLRLKFTKYPLK